jgi:hypothetical protein
MNDDLSLTGHHCTYLSSILDSTDEIISFNCLLELGQINSINLISVLSFLYKCFHLLSLLFVSSISNFDSLLFINKLFVYFNSGVGNNWYMFFFFSSSLSFFFFILHRFIFIHSIGSTNKNEEKDECQPCFNWTY